jgi:hypothetical protein
MLSVGTRVMRRAGGGEERLCDVAWLTRAKHYKGKAFSFRFGNFISEQKIEP